MGFYGIGLYRSVGLFGVMQYMDLKAVGTCQVRGGSWDAI